MASGEKLIALMNQYGIKGTFNLNSGDVLFQQIEHPRERYYDQFEATHSLELLFRNARKR